MKPATPLPWALMNRGWDGEYWAGITSMIGQSAPLYHAEALSYSDADGAKDAAYIVHACNAYPKLVEALNDMTQWVAAFAYGNGENAHKEVMKSPRMEKAIALLRELGELK